MTWSGEPCLGEVEDNDVISQCFWVKVRVIDDLLHSEDQLGQITFILYFPVVFSQSDLI